MTTNKQKKVKPGYQITEEAHDIVKIVAVQLTLRYGVKVSANQAVEFLIWSGYDSISVAGE